MPKSRQNHGILIWITGISGAGKSTLAVQLVKKLKKQNRPTLHLDGDELRAALSDLTQTSSEDNYSEKSRRLWGLSYARLASILVQQNFTVVVSTVSLIEEVFQLNRSQSFQYFEVFLDVDQKLAAKFHPKMLYQDDKIKIVGRDIPAFIPENPDLTIKNDYSMEPSKLADMVLIQLDKKFYS